MSRWCLQNFQNWTVSIISISLISASHYQTHCRWTLASTWSCQICAFGSWAWCGYVLLVVYIVYQLWPHSEILRTMLRKLPLGKIGKRVGRLAGAEVYTAPGMQAYFRWVHDCMPTRVYWKYKPQTTSIQFKETENKQDLLAREVVGTQISFCWANGWLEVPELTPIYHL